MAGIESLEARELLAADVSVLKDILPGSASSLLSKSAPQTRLIEFNSQVYFNANDGVHGFELWRTDGTGGEGTQLFMDLVPGSTGSFPDNFIVANGKLFFTASGGLYVTDGTQAGTTQLLATTKIIDGIAAVGSTAFYYVWESPSGNTGSPGGTFWKTDGTVANTVSFATWLQPAAPISPTVFDNAIFFVAPETSTLYKLNPALDTVAEVSSAFTVSPGSDSYPAFAVSTAGLFFAGKEPSVAPVLWILSSADGTPSKVQVPASPSIALGPQYLTTSNNRVYFTALTSANGYELWSSDGTSAGTSMVKDIIPGTAGTSLSGLTDIDGVLFFSAGDGIHGHELWKSEGLASNTIMVKDIVPGLDGSAPQGLFNLNGLLTFFARNPESLSETLMWSSDGTDAGTSPIGPAPNSPAFPVALGNSEIFAGEDASSGREPFIARFGVTPATPVVTGPVGTTANLRPTVTWNAVPGVTNYEVWIRNKSTNQNSFILETVAGLSFTPSSDLGIGNYSAWVRVAGTTDAPPSLWSANRNFRIKAPVTLNPVATNPANGLSMISWLPQPGAVKYDVWIDRLDVPTSPAFRDMNVTGTNVTPPFLVINGKYRVFVRGFAADGADGAWSVYQDFVAVHVPAITGGLNPTFDTTPTITWTAVPGAASYEVYIRSINGNFKALHQKNIAATTFTWPTLTPGPYEYWVRATGATVWSISVFISTEGQTDVLVPIGNISSARPTFTWRPVDERVRYELWVDRLGVQEKIIYETNLTSANYTPPANLPSGNYRAWVRAVGSSATAPWSLYVDFTIASAESSSEQGSELLASVFADSRLTSLLDQSDAAVAAPAFAESAADMSATEQPES